MLLAGSLKGEIQIDGVMDEADWDNAQVLSDFLTTEPLQKGTPSSPTLARVLVNEKAIFIGVECKDPEPDKIVWLSKLWYAASV